MELFEFEVKSIVVLIIILVVTVCFGYFHLNKRSKKRSIDCEVSKQCGVSVRLIRTTQECIDNINDLLAINPPVLGFDCEWKPYFDSDKSKNAVSLLQLSNQHICLLIRLKDIFESETGIPKQLIHLLINPELRFACLWGILISEIFC